MDRGASVSHLWMALACRNDADPLVFELFWRFVLLLSRQLSVPVTRRMIVGLFFRFWQFDLS